MLTLNEWSEILIQQYEKSFGLGLDNKVFYITANHWATKQPNSDVCSYYWCAIDFARVNAIVGKF